MKVNKDRQLLQKYNIIKIVDTCNWNHLKQAILSQNYIVIQSYEISNKGNSSVSNKNEFIKNFVQNKTETYSVQIRKVNTYVNRLQTVCFWIAASDSVNKKGDLNNRERQRVAYRQRKRENGCETLGNEVYTSASNN